MIDDYQVFANQYISAALPAFFKVLHTCEAIEYTKYINTDLIRNTQRL